MAAENLYGQAHLGLNLSGDGCHTTQLKPQPCNLQAVWLWASYLASLSLGLFTCVMGLRGTV